MAEPAISKTMSGSAGAFRRVAGLLALLAIVSLAVPAFHFDAHATAAQAGELVGVWHPDGQGPARGALPGLTGALHCPQSPCSPYLPAAEPPAVDIAAGDTAPVVRIKPLVGRTIVPLKHPPQPTRVV